MNFPNEISKRNLERLLCEKKNYSANGFKYFLALFVFLTTLNCFGKTVAFLFYQGRDAREMSRVYIYIYNPVSG